MWKNTEKTFGFQKIFAYFRNQVIICGILIDISFTECKKFQIFEQIVFLVLFQ